MKNLPNEIVSIILSYEGSMKERNGKYMKQIEKHDKRYNLLRTIPKKNNIYINNNYFLYTYNSFSICNLKNDLKITITEYNDKICHSFYKNDYCMETIDCI